MTIRLFICFIFATFITSLGWALSYSIYDELSSYIINTEEGLAAFKSIPSIQLEQKIESLKNQGEDRNFYEVLEKIVKQDNGPIKKAELAQVLSMLRTKYHRGPMDTLLKAKLTNFFTDLVMGEKRVVNVAVVGRTRGGKSTFLATMIDPLDPTLHQSIAKSSIFSHTETSSRHLALFESYQQGLYVARFIDTPGLSEVKPVGSNMKARSDEEIIYDITNSIFGLTIDKVFLIFALSSAGLNKEDINALKKLKIALAEKDIFSGKIDLIFPRADQMSASALKTLIKELTSNFSQWGIAQNDYHKTYSSGSLINEDFHGGRLQDLLSKSTQILMYRNIILQDIFGVQFFEGLVCDFADRTVDTSPVVTARIKKIIPARKRTKWDSWLQDLEKS